MSAIGTEIAASTFAIRMAQSRRAGEPIPGEVSFELTHRCNLACRHCYLEPCRGGTEPAELSTAGVARVLDQLAGAGVYLVNFTGGEILTRPDIFQILGYARDRGLFFGLTTNGTLITEPVADRLKQVGAVGVDISLYGARPTTHDLVTNTQGSYRRTLHAIRLLRARGIRVGIKTTLMKINVREHQEIETLAEQLGATYSPDLLVFPKIGQPGSAAGLRLDDEQLKILVIERKWDIKSASPCPEGLEPHLICGAARTRCAISPRGEVLPCTTWRVPLGNLKQQAFAAVWNGEAANRIRTVKPADIDACHSCELIEYCARCPGMAHMENGGILGPASENCRLARAIKGEN